MLFFKFLTKDNHGSLSGFKWPVPVGGFPGEWVEVEGELVMCNNGIHVCEWKDVFAWLDARMYLVEVGGECVSCDNKLAFRRARLVHRVESWNDRTARLFAADCAERAARCWVPVDALDWNPADTIDVVRRFANGDATQQELEVERRTADGLTRTFGPLSYANDWAVRACAMAAETDAHAPGRTAFAALMLADDCAAETKWQLARLDHYVGDELRAYSAMGGSE